MIDRQYYWECYRKQFTKLNQSQVDGINFLLDKLDASDCFKLATEYAYILATIKHETAERFQPIKELGGQHYLQSKPYYPYFGRGYVQLTWKANYIKFENLTGLHIVANPDLVLEPEMAWMICEHGFYHGDFTGKKMSDYINEVITDFPHARKIINGMDKSQTIATYARKFEQIIKFE